MYSGLQLAFSDLPVLFTKTNANPSPGLTDHSVASQNIYWRIKAQNRRSLVSLDRPRGGGGGVATESEEGEFSGPNDKPDTDGQPYLNNSIY